MPMPHSSATRPAREPILSILIVSYNTRAMTVACLDSIAAETRDTSCEIIVVDNASVDGSAEAIATHPIRPRLIRLQDNIGFARANNLAARSAKGRLLLLLNPDTVILDRAIDRLVEFAVGRPQAMIWGGRTMFADGSLNPSSAWGRMTLWRLFCRATGLTAVASGTSAFNGEAIGGWSRDGVREVDIVSGCFFLVERAFWQRLGGFDPAYFMYGEEADLCLRARHLGARPAVTPDAAIIHHGGASEATREGKMVKLLAAKATLIERHFSPFGRGLGLALHAAWPLGRWLSLALAAHVGGGTGVSQKAEVWRAVWHRRSEWRHGWRRQVGNEIPATPANAATV